MGKDLTNQTGFTLIEVTMAMVILGVGIMSIVALQTRDMMYNNNSRRQAEAYTWAMDRIEHLRALSYTDTDLGVSATEKTASEGPYSIRWLVSDNSTDVANTKKVDVTVFWNNNEISKLTFTRTQSSI
nr:prepilin-type N-terminal cleavage/methylation domain-containing protein [uncultured Desulfobulbus sp.]